jgi:hypothetical protein
LGRMSDERIHNLRRKLLRGAVAGCLDVSAHAG